MNHLISIHALGAQGDGVGTLNGKTVYVSGALPGETVLASGAPPRLLLEKIQTASPDRISPECPHFESCGGCTVQHLSQEAALSWKRQLVVDAFAREGLTPLVGPCVATSTPTRRRVTFTATRQGEEVVLGYKERASERLVNIHTCPILLPQLSSHLDVYRGLAANLLRGREELQILITATDNGLDLAFTLPQDATEQMLAAFVRSFAKTGFIRASINGETVFEKDKPQVQFGHAVVELPSGAFLQAVVKAENAMAELVMDHLKSAKYVVDLFCGSGTFALRLAQRSRVHAVEALPEPLAALKSGSGAEGLKPITMETRDLDALPLTAQELQRFEGVCLDPPRAGAEMQIREIAKADLRRIAYVSCNPKTLARDSALLVEAGYSLEKVVPVDQFKFSHHVEAVALFNKAADRSKRSIFKRR